MYGVCALESLKFMRIPCHSLKMNDISGLESNQIDDGR